MWEEQARQRQQDAALPLAEKLIIVRRIVRGLSRSKNPGGRRGAGQSQDRD